MLIENGKFVTETTPAPAKKTVTRIKKDSLWIRASNNKGMMAVSPALAKRLSKPFVAYTVKEEDGEITIQVSQHSDKYAEKKSKLHRDNRSFSDLNLYMALLEAGMNGRIVVTMRGLSFTFKYQPAVTEPVVLTVYEKRCNALAKARAARQANRERLLAEKVG